MSSSENIALVVSVHSDVESRTLLKQTVQDNTVRINIKWQGKHDLADFDVDRLGKVVSSDIDTEHTGWAIIEPRRTVKPGDTIPLRK
jgi:hypothetical protein